MTERAGAAAFTAEFRLIAQSDVQHPAFPAVHRIKAERRPCTFYILSGSGGADTQFRNADGAVFVGIERDAGMVVRVEPQYFLGYQLQREQKFRAVREQKIDIGTGEFDDEVRAFLGIAAVTGFNGEGKLKARIRNDLAEELFDSGSGFVDGILWIQAVSLSVRLSFKPSSAFAEA